jgi:hypothetical protein
MFIVSTIMKLFRLSFAIMTLLVIAVNRWMAFAVQLSMMFVIWNALLVVIGIVSTIQMTVGFCFDVMKLTSGRKALSSSKSSAALKDRNGPEGYWQSRRKTYQEMIDKLYVKYMERLVGVQQQQAQYYWDQSPYIYPQSRYQNKTGAGGGDVYIDGRNAAEYYHQYHQHNMNDYYDDDYDEFMTMDNGEGSSDRNYETNSDGISEVSSFTPGIKITEDTSATIM